MVRWVIFKGEVTPVTPEETIHRLLDALEENRRLFEESRHSLQEPPHGELIEILHDCEQLGKSQVRLLQRALRRLGRR